MNNSTEVVSLFERYDDLQFAQRFVPQVLMIERCNFPLWSIIGIPGGIFSILIWSSRPMRRGGSAAAAVYQTCLGIGDVTFLLVYLTWHLQMSWHMHILDHPIICEAFPVFHYCAQYLTATLTFTFTLERFLAICYPFKSQHCLIRSKERGALKLMAILTAFCFGVSSVQSLFFSFNGKTCEVRPEVNMPSDIRYTLYRFWAMLTEIVFFFGMPITCLILNVFVIRVIRQSAKAKRHNLISVVGNGPTTVSECESDRNERCVSKGTRSSTLTLLCTSFYMIAVQLATAATIVFVNFMPMGDENLTDEEIEKDPKWRAYMNFLIARALVEGFGLTHYAAKFPIYMATSKQFRQEFCRRFCPCAALSRERERQKSITEIQQSTKVSLCRSRSDLYRAKRSQSGVRPSSIGAKRNPKNSFNNSSLNEQQRGLMAGQSRQRPSPGYTRTVIGPDGSRVPVSLYDT